MPLASGFQNWYEVLEISLDASHLEVQKAYHRAKETYSPNSAALYTMFTEDEARDLLKLIEEAFAVLGNVTKREEYDRSLKGIHTSSPAQSQAQKTKVSSTEIDIPKGFAKTKHGVYELKPEIEEEIKTHAHFDGEFLKKIRQYKNLTLDHLSLETRISRTYLAAIEENNYPALPAPVFVRGFIVQVSKALGLPEQKVASSYMDILKTKSSK